MRSTGRTRLVVSALTLFGALTILASGIVHLRLWGQEDGYRAVPTIGPLFLLQGICGCLLAVAIVVLRRPVVTLAGAAYMAASVGGLVVSIRWGLFGYDETLGAPWATFSLLDELLGLVVLLAAFVLAAASRPPSTSTQRPSPDDGRRRRRQASIWSSQGRTE